jgi:ABC-type dipeptide/oligopeptide/nickel transport system ATPase component
LQAATARFLNLLLDIQKERGVAYLMISHDLSIACAFADRVAVMLRGEVVESGPAVDVLRHPRHEYTKRLLAAMRRLDPTDADPDCSNLTSASGPRRREV